MASLMVKADLVVVGILSVGVTTLIVDFTLDRTFAVIILAVGIVVVLGLWLAVPVRLSRSRPRS